MRQGPERARVPAPIPAQLPVFEHKGQLVADSREVAALIERPHCIVLRTIRAMELSKGQWFTTLKLTRTPSGFGGNCAYWLCPRCGKRVRFLYFKGRGFVCRYLARYRRYQEKHRRDTLREMLAILGR